MKKKTIGTVIAAAALSAALMFGVNSVAGNGWLKETVMAADGDGNGGGSTTGGVLVERLMEEAEVRKVMKAENLEM